METPDLDVEADHRRLATSFGASPHYIRCDTHRYVARPLHGTKDRSIDTFLTDIKPSNILVETTGLDDMFALFPTSVLRGSPSVSAPPNDFYVRSEQTVPVGT
jgi:hypothetical protein